MIQIDQRLVVIDIWEDKVVLYIFLKFYLIFFEKIKKISPLNFINEEKEQY